jgi:hypothetical protein
MFNLKDFYFIRDFAPNLPLSEIFPVSRRIMTLLFRNQQKQIIESNFINFYGVVDMIEGLEHHRKNFMVMIEQRSKISILSAAQDEERRTLEKNLRHETIAYLNRIGQLYRFAVSKFVKSQIPNSVEFIPTVSKLKFFRDKHAAHRSIDWPSKDEKDDSHAQIIQAFGLSSISALMFDPKDKSNTVKTIEDMHNSQKMWCEHYLCFQMRGKGKGEFVYFSVEKEHPKILDEVFNLIETFIAKSL